MDMQESYESVCVVCPRVVRRLIAAGADVGIADDETTSPLIVCKNADIGVLLLENDADMDETDMNGRNFIAVHTRRLRKRNQWHDLTAYKPWRQ
jgi:hypothetical protein